MKTFFFFFKLEISIAFFLHIFVYKTLCNFEKSMNGEIVFFFFFASQCSFS